jgi:BarA-like signal transduction histidine kinase
MGNRTINILAIGRNAEIMQVMQRLINVPDKWTGVAVTTDEEAIAAFGREKYDMVLLCAGISAEEESALKEQLFHLDPASIIIRHYGGGSGLLENEILAALDQQNFY